MKTFEIYFNDLNEDADLRGANLKDADLRGADLRGADLMGANLKDANLRGADLENANLYAANLRGANLENANLKGADLMGANLIGANLENANLRGANLRGVNLMSTFLMGADLRDTDLRGVFLMGANLRGANLDGADLEGANLTDAFFQANNPNCKYRTGKVLTSPILGYKKCKDNVIVTLEIPRGAIVFSINGRKCRTNIAKVIDIEGADRAFSTYNILMSYYVGDVITVYNFNCQYNIECSSGIHFFLNKEDALKYSVL